MTDRNSLPVESEIMSPARLLDLGRVRSGVCGMGIEVRSCSVESSWGQRVISWGCYFRLRLLVASLRFGDVYISLRSVSSEWGDLGFVVGVGMVDAVGLGLAVWRVT